MTYGITRSVFDDSRWIELTAEEYQDITRARDGLLNALLLEEKIDLLAENYVEFESSLLQSSTRYMVFGPQGYQNLQAQRRSANRRITNLLAACRLYLDHCAHHVSAIYGAESPQLDMLRRACTEQYDGHLEYRAMDALRNHLQHRELPVHSVGFGVAVVPESEPRRDRFTIALSIQLRYLEQDPTFKPRVLRELRALGDTYDATAFARVYVNCIGSIHRKAREILSADLVSWESTVRGVLSRYAATFGETVPLIGLAVEARHDNQESAEIVPILEDLLEYRRDLAQKNRSLQGLSRSYVSGLTRGSAGS